MYKKLFVTFEDQIGLGKPKPVLIVMPIEESKLEPELDQQSTNAASLALTSVLNLPDDQNDTDAEIEKMKKLIADA